MSADLNIQPNRFENTNFSLFVKLEELFRSRQYKSLKIVIRGRITFWSTQLRKFYLKAFTASQEVPRHYNEGYLLQVGKWQNLIF